MISFDKPGTGLSDPVEGVPTLEERMEDLTAVLDAVGVERAALFGASEGAPMSALFAATHVERVIALVVYGSYAKGSCPVTMQSWSSRVSELRILSCQIRTGAR